MWITNSAKIDRRLHKKTAYHKTPYYDTCCPPYCQKLKMNKNPWCWSMVKNVLSCNITSCYIMSSDSWQVMWRHIPWELEGKPAATSMKIWPIRPYLRQIFPEMKTFQTMVLSFGRKLFFSVDGYQNIIKETKMYLTVLQSAFSQVSKITTSVDQKKNGSLGTLFAILNSKHLRCLA